MNQSFVIWLVIYLAVILIVAILNRQNKLVDFYRSNSKPLSVFILIFTFCATLFSSFFVVGIPGFIHNHGTGTIYWVLIGDVLGALGIFYIGRKFISKLKTTVGKPDEVISPLEVLSPNRTFSVIFLLATCIFILPYLAIQITGVGKLLVSASNGNISFVLGTIIVMLVMYIYSFIAGIRGVAISDAVQGSILFFVVLFVSGYALFGIFDGPVELFKNLSEKYDEYQKLPGPNGYFTPGLLISYVIMFAFLPITQPQFLTRYLLVSNTKELKKVAIGFGLVLCISFIPITIIGLTGLDLYPDIKDSDFLLGKLLSEHFSEVFTGFVFVGVLAAAMSTADSILLSLGQMFSRDIYKNILKSNLTPQNELLTSKLFILIMAVLAFIVSLNSSDLILYLSRASFAGTLQLAPAIIGNLYARKKHPYAGSLSIIFGIVTMLILRSMNLPLGLDSSIYGLISGTSVYLVVSKLTIFDTKK